VSACAAPGVGKRFRSESAPMGYTKGRPNVVRASTLAQWPSTIAFESLSGASGLTVCRRERLVCGGRLVVGQLI
jgi:hypothetical protein